MILGHAFLCASAIFSLHLYSNDTITWSYVTFVLLLGHGVLGILMSCGCPRSQQLDLFQISLEIIDILPIPLLNTEFYLTYYNDSQVAYLYAVTAAIPILLNCILKERVNEDIKNLLIIGNIISLLYLGIQKEKIMYGALAGIASYNRFNIGKGGRRAERLSFGLAGFCLVAAYIIKTHEFSKYL